MDAKPTLPKLAGHLAQIAQTATEREAERRRQRETRPMGKECWYLVREARRFKEDDAAELFKEYGGIDTYCPKYRTMVAVPLSRITIKQRRRGFIQREEKLVPLFKGFRLMNFDIRRPDWREIFDRAKLTGMLASGQNGRLLPHEIPDRVLEQFRQREALGALPGSLSMRVLGVAVGDAVRIGEGHFSGYNGTVEKLPDVAIEEVDEEIRIKLAVLMFGQVVPVELPLSHIEKL